MSKKKSASALLSFLCLALILALGFGVRAASAPLSAIPAQEGEFYRDGEGIPYLTDMDSYFYLRLAREMAEADSPFLYNQRPEDPLMSARPQEAAGQGLPIFLSTVTYFVWKFLRLFFPVSLTALAYWMGPVLGSLAAIPAFLYVKKRTNLFGGAAAGLLAGLAIPFVAKTHGGFFDTDMLLAALPLGFILCQLRAMQEERLSRQGAWALAAGLLLALLSLVWSSFYTYFWLMALGGLAGLIPVLLYPFRYSWKRRLAALRGYVLAIGAALALVFLFRGLPGIRALGGILSVFGFVSASSNSFPFVHQFTAEMQPLSPLSGSFAALLRGSADSLVNQLGGLLPLLLAAGALVLALIPQKKRPEGPHGEIISSLLEGGMLLLWLGAGIKLALPRQRFMEIAVLPLAVLAGLGVGRLARLVKGPRPLAAAAGCLLALSAALPMGLGAWETARGAMPGATDAKAEALSYADRALPQDTAVAAWWDDGYFIQYAARRRAPADGGTSSGAVNYFLGKALLTEDPAQMAGIFRMLETSATQAVDLLTGLGASQPQAAALLLDMAALPRDQAGRAAAGALSLTPEDTARLLSLTHPTDEKPLALLLSADLLPKLSAIAYFGQWDMEERQPGPGVYWSVSTASGALSAGGECRLPMLDPAIAVTVQKDTGGRVDARMDKDGKEYQLSRLCLWRDGVLVQDGPLPGTGPALVLVEEGGRVCAFSCSPGLEMSMFVRLFIAGDSTLPGFALHSDFPGMYCGDPCPAQQRMAFYRPACCGAQVWEIRQSLLFPDETPLLPPLN